MIFRATIEFDVTIENDEPLSMSEQFDVRQWLGNLFDNYDPPEPEYVLGPDKEECDGQELQSLMLVLESQVSCGSVKITKPRFQY